MTQTDGWKQMGFMGFRVIRQLPTGAGAGFLIAVFVSTAAGMAAPNPQEATISADNPFGAYLAGRERCNAGARMSELFPAYQALAAKPG